MKGWNESIKENKPWHKWPSFFARFFLTPALLPPSTLLLLWLPHPPPVLGQLPLLLLLYRFLLLLPLPFPILLPLLLPLSPLLLLPLPLPCSVRTFAYTLCFSQFRSDSQSPFSSNCHFSFRLFLLPLAQLHRHPLPLPLLHPSLLLVLPPLLPVSFCPHPPFIESNGITILLSLEKHDDSDDNNNDEDDDDDDGPPILFLFNWDQGGREESRKRQTKKRKGIELRRILFPPFDIHGICLAKEKDIKVLSRSGAREVGCLGEERRPNGAHLLE